jgi:magnesium transporter
MRPTLLHGIAAPSPSVLSFLRTQIATSFELQGAPGSALRKQQFGTTARTRWRQTTTARGGRLNGQQTPTVSGYSSLAPQKCLVKQRSQRSAFAISLADLRDLRSSSYAKSLPFVPCRTFSATRTNPVWNMFSSARKRRLAQIQPPGPPPEDGQQTSAGFGSSLGRISRPANELKMRCTELDEHGNVTLVSGEFKKSELIAKVR